MKRSVLIIDDEKEQAEGLVKVLAQSTPNTFFSSASSESDIVDAIEQRYFSIAIVDLRMDTYTIDGQKIIEQIIEVNPFAKIIIVSAYTDEYFSQIKDLLLTGKIIDVVEKKRFEFFSAELKIIIDRYHDKLFEDPSEINNALLEYYSQVKNETDAFKKGEVFENFVSLLFRAIGYTNISKRIKDTSLNEVDLIIRNEISDPFLDKFGKYILVECKNKPNDKIDKNTFIIFDSKVHNTNGLSELGILATTGSIARTVYIEAARSTKEHRKILIISNNEFHTLILASDKLEAFKELIDTQVKNS